MKGKIKLFSSLFITTVLATSSVYAEYYFVPGPCGGCAVHRYHRIHYHHHYNVCHHRYHHYVFKRVYYSPCACSAAWQGYCNSCGHGYGYGFGSAGYGDVWGPDGWQQINYGYVEETPGYHYYYGDEDYINYDPDLATGDDNQSVYPDMDIDE